MSDERDTDPAPEYEERIGEIARRLRTSAPSTTARPVRRMPEPDLKTQDARLDLRLKKIYAYGLLAMMVVQLVVVNAVFVAYAHHGRRWQIEPSVMHVWLVSTLVEIIGIIYVVTKYLFPNRDTGVSTRA